VDRKRVKQSGFTLLELLVVISIIALLTGLLLPSLRNARDQAKQLGCSKNLHNIWRGVYAYATSGDDRIPYLETRDPKLDPFDPKHPTMVGNVLGPYVERWSFVCPSAVAGYPETDPKAKRKWKLTYDFSTPDRPGRAARGLPYDSAVGAFSGKSPDPAVLNEYHFDGRPYRMLKLKPVTTPPPPSGSSSVKAEIIWTTSAPLVSDTLAEDKPGDILAGRPQYPHRGVVRRQTDLFRSLMTTSDPRLVTSRRPGYYHLHANGDNAEVFLTRVSPDTASED
jgi:prepilin-type N-terminal cleavage/methylation domain-containing protein